MPKCEACGAELPDDGAPLCAECGAELGGRDSRATVDEPSAATGDDPSSGDGATVMFDDGSAADAAASNDPGSTDFSLSGDAGEPGGDSGGNSTGNGADEQDEQATVDGGTVQSDDGATVMFDADANGGESTAWSLAEQDDSPATGGTIRSDDGGTVMFDAAAGPGTTAGGTAGGDSASGDSASGDTSAGRPTPAEPGPGAEKPSPGAPTLHGGPAGEMTVDVDTNRPRTRVGNDHLTRQEDHTPPPPHDSDNTATVDLDRKIKKLWSGAESADGSPSATMQVEVSHLEKDSFLSVSARPIAYPEAEPSEKADYRVEKFVAKGGMGRVYLAQQTSLGRTVALKTLSDELAKKERYRQKFFAEASITGVLDHPNIVPIHDLGVRSDGVPFYSMKFVTGEPWQDSIADKSKSENLSILMRVADAVAFAHSRKILHRDLKPENVMLGEYGEVLVVDWGLAIHLERDKEFSLGGTPLYMAPEMANHDVPLIGVRSDVYLLGAMLFEVLEGKAPHATGGKTATERLLVAAMNRILPHKSVDELIDVALKAMATNPSDRYQDVLQFQQAIRECQRHSDSRERAERAAEELRVAQETGENERYSRALFAYQDAINLWPDNKAAAEGLQAARLAYAEHALAQQDYGLGLSLLDPGDPSHQPLREKLLAAQRQEQQRGRRLKIARNLAIGATAATVLSLTGFAFFANSAARKQARLTARAEAAATEAKRQEGIAVENEAAAKQSAKEARESEQRAIKAQEEEEAARLAAEQAKALEEQAKTRAEESAAAEREAKDEAVKQERLARASEEKAQHRAFVAEIALTAADLAVADTDTASERLTSIERDYPSLLDWEADRLRYLCHRDFPRQSLGGDLTDMARSPGGTTVAMLTRDAEDRRLLVGVQAPGQALFEPTPVALQLAEPRRVALGPKNQIAVAGTLPGGAPAIELWRLGDERGHAVIPSPDPRWRFTAMAFSPTGAELAVAHHAPLAVRVQVVNVAAGAGVLDPAVDTAADFAMAGAGSFTDLAFSPDALRLAAVERSDDATQASVTVWSRRTPLGPFGAKSKLPVDARSIAFHPTNPRLLACGEAGGKLVLWNTPDNGVTTGTRGNPPLETQAYDRHEDDIRRVAFSPDGQTLVTASESGLALLWTRTGAPDTKASPYGWRIDDRPNARHLSALRGAGWSPDGETLLTADADGLIRAWPLAKFHDARRMATAGGAAVNSVAATADGRFAMVADANGHTRVYDPYAPNRPTADLFVGHPGRTIERAWPIDLGVDSNQASGARGGAPQDSLGVATLGFRRGEATLVNWSTTSRRTLAGVNAKDLHDLSPDGKTLAVASLQDVRVLRVRDSRVLARSTLAAASIAYLPSGRLAVGDARGRLSVFAIGPDGFRRVAADTIAPRRTLTQLAATEDGAGDVVYAATEGTPGQLYRVTITRGGAVDAQPLPPLPAAVSKLAAAGPHAAAVVSGGALFTHESDAEQWAPRRPAAVADAVIDGRGRLTIVGADGRITRDGEAAPQPLATTVEGAFYQSVGLLGDGGFFAVARSGGTTVVDRFDADGLERFESRSPIVLGCPAAPTTSGEPGVAIATLSLAGEETVWSTALTASPITRRRIIDRGQVLTAAAEPRGRALLAVTSQSNGQVGVLFRESMEGGWRSRAPPAGAPLSTAASCAVKGELAVVWDAATGRLCRWSLAEPAAAPKVWNSTTPSVADGWRPVAVGAERVAAIAEGAGGQQLLLWYGGEAEPTRAPLDATTVTALAFSPSGDRLLAGTENGRIIVYDVSTQVATDGDRRPRIVRRFDELTTFARHRRPVTTLRFSPDGRTLISGDRQGEVIWWPTATVTPAPPMTASASN
ncbi:MAG: protein kinase [Planctomycetota bacterium]